MFVSSYLELYLALFGWHLYSQFWDIASGDRVGVFAFHWPVVS